MAQIKSTKSVKFPGGTIQEIFTIGAQDIVVSYEAGQKVKVDAVQFPGDSTPTIYVKVGE